MSRYPYGLVLDIQGSQSAEYGQRGIGRFVVEHARALLRFPGLVRGLVLNPLLPFPGHLPADLLTSPALTWGTATAFRRAEREGPFALYIMSPIELSPPPETVLPPHAMRPDVPLLATLYDLIPLGMPERYLCDPRLASRYHARLDLFRAADLVLAVSKHSRSDAIRVLGLDPKRIVAVGGGVSPFFRPSPPGSDPRAQVCRALPQIERPYVLCVSGADDRKNTEALITAYARLPRQLRAGYQLVITCRIPRSFDRKWREHARAAGLADSEMVLTNYVPDQVLRNLYRAAELFVFPSLDEGFGLPIAEALACGSPAITSSTTSLPEILDWEASTFDPTDPSAMAVAIQRTLCDPKFREQLRAIGQARAPLHTWAAVAERTIAALERLPPPRSRPSSPARRRLRVALVGPMPPVLSGIADYNGYLAPELAARCELDLFSPAESCQTPSGTFSGARHFPLRLLGTRFNPAAYDAIIYTLGNSEHHHETYDVARRYPGIVWPHDVRLGGFYLTYGAARHSDDGQAFVAAKLTEQYGSRVPGQVIGAWKVEDQHRFGLGLTSGWVRGARGVLVNSRLAEQLLRLDQGPNGPLPPVWRLPFAVPPPPAIDSVTRDEPPLIISAGFLAPIKAPEALIEALRLVREHVPARLAIVGPVHEGYRRTLRAQAEALGIAEHVELPGVVEDLPYQRWFGRATCAAQLRLATNGESSLAIGDCLSAGLPVVTNMIGAKQEYSPDAVVPLDPELSVEELADRLTELLTRPETWQRHREAALAHAREFTFARVAEEVLGVVESLITGTSLVLPNASRDV